MLRKHQSELLTTIQTATADYLQRKRQIVAHVWPGGGKSALPVVAGNALIRKGVVQKVVVVVPRLTLKRQGAEAFQDGHFRKILGHTLEIREAGNDANPDRGTAGYITTYDAIRHDPALHADFFRRYRCLLVLDEVHHVADGSESQKALQPMYDLAAFRLLMTGTLDRNEGDRIAFMEYAAPGIDGKLFPGVDIAYGLQNAIEDRAVIPIEFHHIDGQVTFIDKTGQQVWLGTLSNDDLDCRDGVHAALRTEYAAQLLSRCVEHWKRWRLTHKRSLLLVVCPWIKEANAWQKALADMDVESAIATSEDSDAAQEAIKRFRAHGTPPALVTVSMAYEGMDVKSITHIACLTHYRSSPWLMQMFGRASRFDQDAGPWASQKAFVFAPDDALMQKAIEYVRNEQANGIAKLQEDEDGDGAGPGAGAGAPKAPIGSVVPLNGEVTRSRASGLWREEDLGYVETAAIQAKMHDHNISGSVIDMAALLRDFHVDLSSLQPEPEQPHQAGTTPGDREQALRAEIESLMRRLDAHTNSEKGTWNHKCYMEAQRLKKRKDLNEQELRYVWKWCCEKAAASGLNRG